VIRYFVFGLMPVDSVQLDCMQTDKPISRAFQATIRSSARLFELPDARPSDWADCELQMW
jgi:hypothetical protein